MAKFRSIKNSFLAGEISPTALGRTDIPQYASACKTLRNMIPMLSGGAYRRPGTFYETYLDATHDYAPRVIPFVFSKVEAYCLLFGRAIGGVSYVQYFRATSNTAPSTSGFATGTHPYIISTFGNFLTIGRYDELTDVQYVQSADILYLVHPMRKPQRVSRQALDTFTIGDFDAGLSGDALRDAWPYRAQNTTSTTLSPSATSGAITITASAAFFDAGHVGSLVKINHAGTIGAAKITAFTDSTHVSATVVSNFGATTATALWWESSWSDYRGWPRTVAFFQQRICYGGNAKEPDTVWFSETSDYNQLSIAGILEPYTSPTGTQPFAITSSSQQLNLIQWLSPEQTLVVGTQGEEFVIDRETTQSGFGCDNAESLVQSRYGSSHNQAIRAGNELFFSLRSSDEIRAFVFNYLEKSYAAEPLQILYDEFPHAESSTGSSGARKFRAFSWDDSRKTLWMCDTSGNLVGMTRDRKLQFTAWHSHRLGGYDAIKTGGGAVYSGYNALDPAYAVCSGSVLSLTTVPNVDLGTDDLWLVVKRKINGSFRYFVERMIGKNVPQDSAYSPIVSGTGVYQVDAASFNVVPSNTVQPAIYTVDGLVGETPTGIAINARGWFSLEGTPVAFGSTQVSGSLPPGLDLYTTLIIWGLPYDSIVEPVRIEAGSQIGTSQGAVKRIHQAVLRFYRTLSAKIGRDPDNLEPVIFRQGSTPMGMSPEFFTGDKLIKVDCDYDRDGGLYLIQDKPLPFTILSIIAEGQTYD